MKTITLSDSCQTLDTAVKGLTEPKFTPYESVPHPNVRPMAYANSLLSMFC